MIIPINIFATSGRLATTSHKKYFLMLQIFGGAKRNYEPFIANNIKLVCQPQKYENDYTKDYHYTEHLTLIGYFQGGKFFCILEDIRI